VKEFGVVGIFLAIQKLKIIMKKVKKLQKLINEVQEKNKAKQKKSVGYFHAEKHRTAMSNQNGLVGQKVFTMLITAAH